MTMKLYHFPVAPNPARVLFYIKEKGLTDIELVLVDFFKGEQNSDAHLARSPQGVVPVLELADGRCFTESLAIIEYLEERFPQPPLIGSTAEQRLQTRSMERMIEMTLLVPVMRLVHATRSPLGLPPNPAVAEQEQSRLPVRLHRLNEQLQQGPFVLGERVSIADCTLLAAYNFAQLGQLDLFADYPALRRWVDHYALRHL